MITVGVDIDRVASAAREILSAIGDDPDRDGLRDTPMRFARMYAELFEGLHQNPAETLSTVFREDHQEMVIVRDIPFYSMCEHHLLPFHGLAHFGYLPDGKIIGLSKIARVVDMFSRRLQVQERLTHQIARALNEAIEPRGVAVVMQGQHPCMMARGVEKQHSSMVTSALLGHFREDARARAEFMQLVCGSSGAW